MTKDVILNLNPESDFGLEGKVTYYQDGHIGIVINKDSFVFNGLKEELMEYKVTIDNLLKLIKDNDPNCPCKPAKEIINELRDKNNDKVKRSSKKD